MRKNDINIAVGIAGLAAAILLFQKKPGQEDSGYGGGFPIPALISGGGEPTAAPLQASTYSYPNFFEQITNKQITNTYSGGSPQSKKELSIIQAAGFSTEGLQGSFDPASNSIYTFAPETATVEKKLISRAGFSTEGLQGSFDPETGKITTFGGSGITSYATTKKEAAIAALIPSALAGSSYGVTATKQGGATVYTQSSGGGGGGGGSRSGFSW